MARQRPDEAEIVEADKPRRRKIPSGLVRTTEIVDAARRIDVLDATKHNASMRLKQAGIRCLVAAGAVCLVPFLIAAGVHLLGDAYWPFAWRAHDLGDLLSVLFAEIGWNVVAGIGLGVVGLALLLASRHR